MKYSLIGLLLMALGGTVAAELPVVRIGIAIDGPRQPSKETLRDSLLPHIRELTQAKFDVRFPADKMIMADGSVAGGKAALDELLQDDEVDLLIAAGAIVAHDVARRGPLPKPVIAAVIFQPQAQGVPLQGDASGVKNLSYISFATDVRSDLQTCLDIAPFEKAAVLFNRAIGEAMPQLVEAYLKVGKELGLEGVAVPVDASAAAVLAAMPEDVDAVFVAFPLRLPPAEFDVLVQGLIERRLPSFSAVGTQQVEAGLLVGLHPQTDFLRLARRIALNVQQTLLGEDPATLPVVFTRQKRVAINMATARAIDTYPSWAILTEAKLLHQTVKKVDRHLTLTAAAREAIEVNLDLLASARQ
jgi:outer membrane protein